MKSSFGADFDLAPIEDDCLRCHAPTHVRFSGLCDACTTELRASLGTDPVASGTGAADAYEPAMHVTPNAVALKDD
ncbi:MAG: hypothetical protein WBD02_07205 [Acidimicrobiia bacterium]